MDRAAFMVALLPAVACGSPSPPDRVAPIAVTTEPPSPLDSVRPVVRFHVTGIGASASALALFDGELSSYYSARLRAGEVPSTLLPRRIEAIGWGAPRDDDAVLAPSVALTPSATYTLVALGVGALATLVVDSSAPPVAERVWPPRASLNGGARSVFCAAEAAMLGQGFVRLDPVGLDATAALGTDGEGSSSDRCVHLDADEPPPPGVALPPPTMGDVAMDPAPIVLDPGAAYAEAPSCSPREVSVGPGCATVEDDRAVLRSPSVPLLWSVRVGDGVRVAPLPADSRLVLTGLVPSSQTSVSGTAVDLSGHEVPFAALFTTAAPRPHVVINEVLANPLGPEPAQEWIELVNDGAVRTDVTGFVISDGGGATVLPRAALDPGEFALVVAQAFEPSDGLDPSPAPGTLLLRVPRIGASGLSNAGEALLLSSADGQVVSRFPAVPASKAGVSVIRRDASSLDDDGGAFFLSPDGSATPGRQNHISPPE